MQEIRNRPGDNAGDPGNEFNPGMLQDVADQLRIQLKRDTQPLDQHEVESLKFCIGWVQGVRDAFVRQSALKSHYAYSMTQLVNSLLMAGYLKESARLKDALKIALRLSIPDHGLQTYLINELDQGHAIPSSTTLQRHRFTISMGLCRWLQDINEQFESQPVVQHVSGFAN